MAGGLWMGMGGAHRGACESSGLRPAEKAEAPGPLGRCPGRLEELPPGPCGREDVEKTQKLPLCATNSKQAPHRLN